MGEFLRKHWLVIKKRLAADPIYRSHSPSDQPDRRPRHGRQHGDRGVWFSACRAVLGLPEQPFCFGGRFAGGDLCFDYFYLPPVGTLSINSVPDWISLLSFLIVAVMISHLTASATQPGRTTRGWRQR